MASLSSHRGYTWRRSRSSSEHRKGSGRFNKEWAKNAVLLGIAALFAGSIGILGVFAYVSRDLPDPNALTERLVKQSTKIYDRTGEHLLYEIYSDENRTLVKMQEGFCKDKPLEETDHAGIPLLAIQATIAAEDRVFCAHHGFTVKGLARAVLFGGSRGGGSTLTQQLVKNAVLSNEKTLTRKAKELILSIELERRYSKDEILQIYFNEIPYGSTYYGIQAAAQNYFRKTVNGLSLAEVATLAALPKSPTTYLNNPDLLHARRDWILNEMVEMGFVTAEAASEAKAQETPVKVKVTNIQAPHFVFYVKEALEERYGRRTVEEGGLKVLTSLNFNLQTAAEEAVTSGVDTRGKQYQFTNASLVAMDPKTGQVLAMVGSKDYFDDDIDGQVNVSLRPRQPGSSFKPIVYAKAFASSYTPNTILWDVKTDFPTPVGIYAPNNYDLKERGPVRAREALQGSLNIPAVEMLYLVGIDPTLNFAESLGYTTFGNRSNFGLAIVLGGGEVKLLEHVNAYATFANAGVHFDPINILKVEDASGHILEEWKAMDGRKVVEPNAAAMISNVLSDNSARSYVFGPTSYLQLGARPVAAKTGTTNDYHDAWTVGYTPSLAAGVWVGNNNYDAMKRGADGSIIAAPIWNQFMKTALKDARIDYFSPPNIPTTGKPMLDGVMPGTLVTIDRASGKLATEFTPATYREQRLYAEYHSLLHYVNRADPLGSAPADPARDPHYNAWETAIRNWLMKKESETGVHVSTEAPPVEYDDLHISANTPTVLITQPFSDIELSTRALDVEVNAVSPLGIRRVEFYLDGFFLGSDVSEPYSLHTTIPNTVSRGYHTLKAVAFDDIDNRGAGTIGIRVANEAVMGHLEVLDPKNGQTIERQQEAYSVVVTLEKPDEYRSVTLWAESPVTRTKTEIATKTNPTSPFITFSWPFSEDGDWVLSATAIPKDGSERLETAGVLVHVVPESSLNTLPPLSPFPI